MATSTDMMLSPAIAMPLLHVSLLRHDMAHVLLLYAHLKSLPTAFRWHGLLHYPRLPPTRFGTLWKAPTIAISASRIARWCNPPCIRIGESPPTDPSIDGALVGGCARCMLQRVVCVGGCTSLPKIQDECYVAFGASCLRNHHLGVDSGGCRSNAGTSACVLTVSKRHYSPSPCHCGEQAIFDVFACFPKSPNCRN